MIGAGFATASLAALVACVPFLGWLVAVPLGIAAMIMAAILIARDKIAAGVLLLVYSFVGIPIIGLVGTMVFVGAVGAVAQEEEIAMQRNIEVIRQAAKAAKATASTKWVRDVSTNAVDDVVSRTAMLTAAGRTGGRGFGDDPILVVRARSNREQDVYVSLHQVVESDDDSLYKATGRIRWNQEPPVTVRFGIGDSHDAIFVPEQSQRSFLQNLAAGKRLLVEVPISGGTFTVNFTPPVGNPL
jgi:type II secretory pathway pseudopilin PulG